MSARTGGLGSQSPQAEAFGGVAKSLGAVLGAVRLLDSGPPLQFPRWWWSGTAANAEFTSRDP